MKVNLKMCIAAGIEVKSPKRVCKCEGGLGTDLSADRQVARPAAPTSNE